MKNFLIKTFAVILLALFLPTFGGITAFFIEGNFHKGFEIGFIVLGFLIAIVSLLILAIVLVFIIIGDIKIFKE